MGYFDQLSAKLHSHSYEEYWQTIFSTILNGFWCRLFAVLFLGLSIWFAFQRRNVRASIVYFVVMLFFAYGHSLLSALKLL